MIPGLILLRPSRLGWTKGNSIPCCAHMPQHLAMFLSTRFVFPWGSSRLQPLGQARTAIASKSPPEPPPDPRIAQRLDRRFGSACTVPISTRAGPVHELQGCNSLIFYREIRNAPFSVISSPIWRASILKQFLTLSTPHSEEHSSDSMRTILEPSAAFAMRR